MKYRKISPCIWNDAKVRELSDKGKLALLFLLTHPHMTPLGAIRANCPGLACELGWSAKAFRKAFGEVLAQGIAREDARATLIWFPNFLKHNMPESPNVVKSWAGAFEDLPESALKKAMLEQTARVVSGLGEGFRNAFQEAFAEAFGEAFPKGMPNQEQEQEQEKKESVFGAGARVERPEPEEVPGETPETPKPESVPSRQPSVAFEQFLEAYPEAHRGRTEAEREWVALEANRALPGLPRLLDALGQWEDSEAWKERGGRFIPSAANFLKREYWLRKPPEPKAQAEDGGKQSRPMTARQAEAKERGDWAKHILAFDEAVRNGNVADFGFGTEQGVCALPATDAGTGGVRAAGQGLGRRA